MLEAIALYLLHAVAPLEMRLDEKMPPFFRRTTVIIP